ncbi:hypothetical protein ACFLXD_02905 [Chloroflexota bacterium]
MISIILQMNKQQILTVLVISFALLILTSCLNSQPIGTPGTAPASAPEATPESTSLPSSESGSASESFIPEQKPLVLSDALTRNCTRTRTSGGFNSIGLAEGEIAVDFTLKDIQGNTVSLAGLLSTKPVVMIFGSFT